MDYVDAQDFWSRVKEILKNRRLSLKELAAYHGIPYSTFRNWIYADILPSLDHSWRIAESLGVSIDYLVTGREKKLNTELGGIRRLLEKANDGIEKMAG